MSTRITPHAKYLKYLLNHKRYVYQEGRKLGLSRVQLLTHDWQKFTPTEWLPYVDKFFGDAPSPRRADGGYDPLAVGEAFTRAWHHHVKHGPHHWQYWCLPTDGGSLKALPMPDKYRREMLADWRGAGLAQGKPDCLAWYVANKDKMTLHRRTRRWAERELDYVSG